MKTVILSILIFILVSPAFCQCSNDSMTFINSYAVDFGNGSEIPCLPKACRCDSFTQVAINPIQGTIFVVAQNPCDLRLLLIEECNTVIFDTCIEHRTFGPVVLATFSLNWVDKSLWMCTEDTIPYNIFLSMKPGTGIHGLVPDLALYTLDTLCPVLDNHGWIEWPRFEPKIYSVPRYKYSTMDGKPVEDGEILVPYINYFKRKNR